MSEPVLRAQLPAIPTSDPTPSGPAGTFTNHGGVSRYTVNSQVESVPASGRQIITPNGNGVLRATTHTDPFTGQSVTTHSQADSVSRASSGDIGPSDAPKFTSTGGRTLMPSEIRGDSLVHIGDQITNVRAALISGLIRPSANGGYESATGATASTEKTPAQQLEEANAQRRAEQEQADKDNLPTVAKFDDATEALLADTIGKVGSIDAQQAVQAAISNNGQLTPELIQRIGSQLGLDKDQMTERSNTIVAAFERQAREVVGESSADAVFAWAKEVKADDLKRAMISHANTGSTDGYAQLSRQYFEGLGDTQAGRALLLATPGVTERGGKLYVNTAKAGLVEYRAALKAGLITAKHG